MQQQLAELAQAAAHPLEVARHWKAEHGQRVIGHFPMHFPGELAHAAGAMSVLIQESEDAISIGLGSMAVR